MSSPREADHVKLIASLFSQDKSLLDEVVPRLEEMFSGVDWISPEILFDRTRYYEREMGWPLHRRFISFKELIPPEALVDVKIRTNGVEDHYRTEGKRRINIDPGYLAMERLVLATGKNYTHRIYLSRGIYGDLTLVFRKGGFCPLEWTYPDYADKVVVGFFNQLRERYKQQLRGVLEGED